MSPPLSLRCELAADESVPSWVSRLAMCNGVASAREFCLDMGLTFQACIDGEPAALAKLCALTGTPVHALERASIKPDGKDFLLRGERISKLMLRRLRMRACPVCVLQDFEATECTGEPAPYGRTTWQLSVFRTCPRHGCALIDTAEGARKTLHDFAWHFRDRRAEMARCADAGLRRRPSCLERYVDDRLEGRPTGAPWLDRLELHAAVATCEMLGVSVTLGGAARIKDLSDDALHRAGDVGCTAAFGGEGAIRNALSDVYGRHDFKSSRWEGASGIYGHLYKSLAFTRQEAAFEPVRDILHRHIVETMPVGPGDIVLGRVVERRVNHSIVTAARETGRHSKRLRKVLATAGLIRADHADLPDFAVIFSAEQARPVLADDADSLTFSEVATYLGTGAVQTSLLVDHDFIRPHVDYRGGQNERRGCYARKDLDAFLARLVEGAEPVDAAPKSLFSIPSAAIRARCSGVDVIRLILEKKLTRLARNTSVAGYFAVLVDPGEIKYRLDHGIEGGVTVGVARSLLWTTTPVVKALIEEGYLRARSIPHKLYPKNIYIIERNVIEDFHREFVLISELSKLNHRRYCNISRALSDIEPAFVIGNARTRFYRRDSIPVS